MDDFPWYVKARGKFYLTAYVLKQIESKDKHNGEQVSYLFVVYKM